MKKQFAKLALTASIVLASVLTLSCLEDKGNSSSNPASGGDGGGGGEQTYKTVKIGEQVWMAENLNIGMGNSICYGNEEANCKKYGRLYDWETAKAACPSGWRLPSDNDWGRLMRYVHSENNNRTAGKYLKAKSGWNDKSEGGSGNGIDKYDFAALPGGYRLSSGKGGSFDNLGNYGIWWSSSIDNSTEYNQAYYRFIDYNQDGAFRAQDETDALFSVRCVQGDEPPSSGTIAGETFVDNRDSKTYRYIKIGTQTWMAENLNFKTQDRTSRCYPTSGSINNNDLDNSNCDKYGRLYSWKVAKAACPKGWHLPSNADWNVLLKYTNPSCPQQPRSTEESGTICAGAGAKLKAGSGWDDDGYGEDTYGFAALPGGRKTGVGDDFDIIGTGGAWWSADNYHSMGMYSDLENTAMGESNKNSLHSVRCVKD